MDKTNLSGKRYLFALSIINDALDDWTEERRTAMILDITEMSMSERNQYYKIQPEPIS